MAAWSIRRKLGLLVTIPLVVLLVGGGVLVTSLTVQYRQTHTARTDADVILPALTTDEALRAEFGASRGSINQVVQYRANTDTQIKQLRPLLTTLAKKNTDSKLSVEAQGTLDTLDTLGDSRTVINGLHGTLTSPKSSPSSIASGLDYITTSTTSLLNQMQYLIQALSDDLAIVSPDRSIAADATFVSSMSQYGASAADEMALFDSIFSGQKTMGPDELGILKYSVANQELSYASAGAVANPQQLSQQNALSSKYDTPLYGYRVNLQLLLGGQNPLAQALALAKADQAQFDKADTARLIQISQIDNQAALNARNAAQAAERSSLIRVGSVAAAVLLTLLVVTALLATIARTVTVPLRRLRAGAVEVASVQLPAAVARIEQDGVNADVSLPPVLPADAYAGPETLEVARAVDDLGAEAVRLATAQVRLRRALDEAFVSMSRRSQSMVEKQLAIIDELESQEQDPDQLRNLFRLDHLAARMRRYNDNLLVLAGSAVRTRATAPVKIAELFRAATSEMEQYERVRLQPVSGASIAGTVAGELVHLLAELLDNAAMYSPPSSAIVLSAAFTADAGLQIEVLDAGVGISPGELDRLNGRLSQPEAIDTQVPSRMGLFVVARLARRGTFGVMLQSRPDASGTIALVRVPATLVIGAPGSTGEMPVIQPSVQQRQLPQSASDTGRQAIAPAQQYSAFTTPVPQRSANPVPAGQPAPAAAAAGVAAEAAAGVRTVGAASGAEGANQAALPRRRRTTTGSPNAGLPAEAMAAAANPATGLFTPITPPSDDPSDRQHTTGLAAINRGPGSQQQPPPPPPPTAPGGLPVRSFPTRNPAQQPAQPPAAQPYASQPEQQPYTPRPWEAAPFSTPGVAPSLESPFIPNRPVEQPAEPNYLETPAAGITGLPGLAPPARRGTNGLPQRPGPERERHQPTAYQDPLTSPAGMFRTAPNPTVPPPPPAGNGSGNWDDDLPTELAARAAAAAGYRPSDPNLPMIGDDVRPDFNDPTPIFDQISVWFTSDPADDAPSVSADLNGEQVIDLREQDERRPSNRWASLGDQRWLATNARAAAAPETEGATETGLPKRRPGANLLPSAATTAPPPIARPAARPVPVRGAAGEGQNGEGQEGDQNAQEAALVRGRLGSYQRGLANARRARTQPAPAPAFDPVGASLFTVNSEAGDNAGRHSGDQEGDQ